MSKFSTLGLDNHKTILTELDLPSLRVAARKERNSNEPTANMWGVLYDSWMQYADTLVEFHEYETTTLPQYFGGMSMHHIVLIMF